MTLAVDFHFSQASLQDYIECQRRFQLRYLVKLAWPAIETEPVHENERHLQAGGQFHHLVHQHLVGLDTERLARIAQNAELQTWWQNYLRFAEGWDRSGCDCHVETSLSASIDKFRLIAKYDAVILSRINDNTTVSIFDWKTTSKRPSRAWLSNRLQTRIYPYLMVRAGASINKGFPIQPEQVEMIYWFANFPDDPERFKYTPVQYEQDGKYLSSLIHEINNLSAEVFELTSQENNCRFCSYRSLCDRGVKAGSMDEVEFEIPGDREHQSATPLLDFEQVAEIEF
jgi:CRISPR/Cas system-associated exonuclease Cas4 (RecB family)